MVRLNRKAFLLPPATKLGQGYNFTGVCDSVHGGGGRVSGPGESSKFSGGFLQICAGGTHPTGMHSCLSKLHSHLGRYSESHKSLVKKIRI